MQIAIIGAGNVGRALASSLTRAGHEVTVTAAHPDHARQAAAATGASAIASSAAAASAADVVVLAIPATAFDEVAGDIAPAVNGKIVIDVANRPTPSSDGPTTSLAEELQGKLPKAKVVKAFNTAFASRMAQPNVAGIAPDGYVAGDDDGAKQRVLQVVESVGFRPVDAGSLAAARTLEGMAWLNIQRNLAGGSWQDAWVLVGPDTLPESTADSRN